MTKVLVTILGLVVAGAVFFGYTRPTYDSVQALQADIAQYDAALERARELQELKRSLLSRYNAFSGEDLTRLNKLLPDHVDNVRLVLDLDSMSARYGMVIQNVLISRGDDSETSSVLGSIGTQASTYDSLSLQFATIATYSNFVRFMQDLESSLRIVDLTALSMQPAGNVEQLEGADPLYQFNVTIKTYWLK